jgi:hypothetical protein
LTVTSWANLELYELGFGDAAGKPMFVRTPFAEHDGLVVMLPRRRGVVEKGGGEKMEVIVLLRTEDMEKLEKDESWRSWA